MVIAPLPTATARLINSGQVFTDPPAAVKELIDNALDAGATTIVAIVAANTLDLIQVTDNGHGIALEDRELACQRYCTSKISTFCEIARLGGSFLGFRGEALASAAALSGKITITTRCGDEIAGTILNYDSRGQMISQRKAAHSIGTTVRISDFLKTLPVRHQSLLRTSAKSLQAIKHIMQSYTLARRHVRFTLKILKTTDTFNWSYVPDGPEASLIDSARKVINKNILIGCRQYTWKDSDGLMDGIKNNEGGYSIIAILPRPDCDLLSISNAGQYVTIDGRPLSTAKSVTKKVVGLYKKALDDRWRCGVSKPFIFIDIQCPLGSYDVNVEPMKDDLVFVDEEHMSEILDRFFRECFPVQSSEFCQYRSDGNPLSAIANRDEIVNVGSPFYMIIADHSTYVPTNEQHNSSSSRVSSPSLQDLHHDERYDIENSLTLGDVTVSRSRKHPRPIDASFQSYTMPRESSASGSHHISSRQSSDHCMSEGSSSPIPLISSPASSCAPAVFTPLIRPVRRTDEAHQVQCSPQLIQNIESENDFTPINHNPADTTLRLWRKRVTMQDKPSSNSYQHATSRQISPMNSVSNGWSNSRNGERDWAYKALGSKRSKSKFKQTTLDSLRSNKNAISYSTPQGKINDSYPRTPDPPLPVSLKWPLEREGMSFGHNHLTQQALSLSLLELVRGMMTLLHFDTYLKDGLQSLGFEQIFDDIDDLTVRIKSLLDVVFEQQCDEMALRHELNSISSINNRMHK